jgi:acyl carrier protein
MSKGYINNEEKTNEVFIDNPFIKGEKIYATGDLGIMHDDNSIELIGREDDQIKIRGFRVELSSIENTLLSMEGIQDCVAIARKGKDENKYLYCYYTGKSYKIEKLRTWISKTLPEYMIPAFFIKLDRIPLNINGKVDRKALPDTSMQCELETEYIAPKTEKEKLMAANWYSIFERKMIGINDNFFSLGGDSIKAINLIAKLQNNFTVEINDIYKYPTIYLLAKNIEIQKDNLKLKFNNIKDAIYSSEKNHKSNLKEISAEVESYNLRNNKYDNLDLCKTKAYRNILLTGGTGFLGSHILKELFDTQTSDIVLIIRGRNIADSMQRLSNKFKYYFGGGNCRSNNFQ